MVNLPIFVSVFRPDPFSIESCRLSRVCSGPRPFSFFLLVANSRFRFISPVV